MEVTRISQPSFHSSVGFITSVERYPSVGEGVYPSRTIHVAGITVHTVANSGQTFPITTQYPFGFFCRGSVAAEAIMSEKCYNISDMTSLTQTIFARMKSEAPGTVFGPRIFSDLGNRAAVDQALSRPGQGRQDQTNLSRRL